MTTYRPGDVVNGHILGTDNQWHPVAPPVLGSSAQQVPGRGYWSRYRSRWWKVALVWAVLTPIFTYLDALDRGPAMSLWEVPLAATFGVLVWGTLFTFLFAIPRDGAPECECLTVDE